MQLDANLRLVVFVYHRRQRATQRVVHGQTGKRLPGGSEHGDATFSVEHDQRIGQDAQEAWRHHEVRRRERMAAPLKEHGHIHGLAQGSVRRLLAHGKGTCCRQADRAAVHRRAHQVFPHGLIISSNPNAPLPGCITSLQHDRILNINQPFKKLMGYAPEEVIGRTTQELGLWSSPQDRTTLKAGIQQEEGVDTYRELPLQVRTKAGATRDILASGETIEVNGQDVWLRLFIDVTERKRTEEELTEAIEEVMSDANWFSTSVIQRLADLREPDPHAKETIDLTQREQQVLRHMARGRSDAQIAADMSIARQTVRNYVATIYSKINVHTRVEAVVWARERGMLG